MLFRSGNAVNFGVPPSGRISSLLVDTTNQIDLQAGGSFEMTCGGASSMRTLMDADAFVGKSFKETIGLGTSRIVSAGGDKEVVLAGNYSISVVGGTISLACSGPLTLASVSSISLVTPNLDLTACDSIVIAPNATGTFMMGTNPPAVPSFTATGIGRGIVEAPAILAAGTVS